MSRLLLLIAALVWVSAIAAAPLQVMTTIKPLQLIAETVAGDRAEVTVLLGNGISPHDYQLKPSDRQKLARADAVFWVGPGLETFLERALTSASGAVVPLQPNGSHEQDAHIWMSPLAAAAIAQTMADTMGKLRPEDAAIFQKNTALLRADMERLDRELAAVFAQIPKPRGFLVSHDAFAGFENRYRIRHQAAIADGHERPPGPRHLLELRELIDHGEVGCVLLEPQYDHKILDAVIRDSAVRKVLIDPLAGSIVSGRGSVERFYRGLGQGFQSCISGS